MMWLVLISIGVAGFATAALYVVGTKRAIKAIGQPTPETAKIEAGAASEAQSIVKTGDEARQEVLHADRSSLLDKLRARVRGQR